MSAEDWRKFCGRVLENLTIQDELKSITDREEFIRKVLEMGKNEGFDFSREDVERQLRENRRNWIERWI